MKDSFETTSKPKTVKELVRSSNFWKPAAGAIVGGVAGFMYYYFVGCASGSCAITSNPFLNILFGALTGLFITNSPAKTY